MVKIAIAASAMMVPRATNITVIAARTISSSLGRQRGMTVSAGQVVAWFLTAKAVPGLTSDSPSGKPNACVGVAVVMPGGLRHADPRIDSLQSKTTPPFSSATNGRKVKSLLGLRRLTVRARSRRFAQPILNNFFGPDWLGS
ncbi:hypothetical protein [Mycobacterium sp. 852002-50816_SCH5313054-b]|uniref:hypothetical protein n=1 Tax=Mycobacterium sp. 852002-50816_SCH5313054-b TaxID=1834092 RepID=UPI0012EA9594|nr:hypothetical protein [Mycobacterium sp. 852002-50816_SCH5313054-b]